MKGKRSAEAINKKVELLKSLGFTIGHQDSSVWLKGFERNTFDFSATACDVGSILLSALSQMHEQTWEHGADSVRIQMRRVLGLQ